MRLSDSIETFIKTLLAEDEPEVELKRNELAEYIGCAPSQINYVLATRFSPAALMRAAMSAQALAIPIPDSMKDAQRARIFKAMLTSIARQNRTMP